MRESILTCCSRESTPVTKTEGNEGKKASDRSFRLRVLMDRLARWTVCARAFAEHGGNLSYLEGSGLLDSGVGHKGSAGSLGGRCHLGHGSDTHGGGGESDSRSHFISASANTN
jgi:hypothetical protein